MGRFIRWCVMLAALAVLAGCAEGEAETPPYPVLDSGFPARSNDKLYWLDNDRLIFVSLGPKPKSLEEKWGVPGIHIWDTRTNKVTLYKSSAEELCFSDGYIMYAVVKRPYDPVDPARWYGGKMGQEQEVIPPKGLVDFSVVQNPHTCRWEVRPEYTKGKGAMPLREGDGWLVSDNDAKEWVWHRPDGQVTRTGIPYWVNTTQWTQFAGGYFFQDNAGTPAGQQSCMPYWWLKPDTGIQKDCVDIRPVKAQWKGNVGLIATPLGILVSANRLSDYGSKGGFYRVEGGKAKLRLTDMGTWSSNGCKAAYVEVPGYEGLRVGGRGDSRLQAIDVCVTNKQGR